MERFVLQYVDVGQTIAAGKFGDENCIVVAQFRTVRELFAILRNVFENNGIGMGRHRSMAPR